MVFEVTFTKMDQVVKLKIYASDLAELLLILRRSFGSKQRFNVLVA